MRAPCARAARGAFRHLTAPRFCSKVLSMSFPLKAPDDLLATLEALLRAAKKAGADAAEAVMSESVALSAQCRMGEDEGLERSEERVAGMRVFLGKKQAGVSVSGPSLDVEEMARRAIAMARAAPEDPYCGLPQKGSVMPHDDLDLCDDAMPDIEKLQSLARRAEDAGRTIQGITNSEGADASWSVSQSARMATNGFQGHKMGTYHSISAVLLAEKEGQMQRDYDYATARHAADLRDPEEIGEKAARRALKRLGAKTLASSAMPVFFESRVARSLLYHFAAAASGEMVARGQSFLKDALGKNIFADSITIIDDPRLPRAPASALFDSEGTPTKKRSVVKDGVLQNFFLDTPSARQLQMKSTGHAASAPGSPPHPTSSNLFLQEGDKTPQQIIQETDRGLYVTELIGQGVNLITGDYSRGAAGFLIEKGEIKNAVHEITIAGNLKDIFAHLVPASDLEMHFATNAPSVLVPQMAVAGNLSS